MADRAKVPLLESQKNLVFRVVEAAGFDPNDFEWQIRPVAPSGHTVDVLTHGEYFFASAMNPRQGFRAPELQPDRLSVFSPGVDTAGARATGFGWEEQVHHVQLWLTALKREVETISLWDTLGSATTRQMAEANLSGQ
jgi:hypothetical protein